MEVVSSDKRHRNFLLLSAIAVCLVAAGFNLYTRHAWEDYYITFRASKNLATGHGLVFTPGERVHSFTSPLGALLPAACSWVAGSERDDLALTLFRVLSVGFLAAGFVLMLDLLRSATRGLVAAVVAGGYLLMDGKTIDFTTNGMETGMLIFFLAYAVWSTGAPRASGWIHMGLAWAGIMWTRPDGFIYIGLLGIGLLAFRTQSEGRAAGSLLFRDMVRSALLCAVLYLPWFLWAWSYYGSPIPHTITAKGSVAQGKTVGGYLATFATLPYELWKGSTSVEGTLLPAYYQPAGWSPVFHGVARVLGFSVMVAWLWPRLPASVRAASFAFHGTHAYLSYFPYYPFPWYFPATDFMAAMVLGGAAGTLLTTARGKRWRPPAAWLCAGSLAALGTVQVILFVATARQMETKQRLNYEANLKAIGLFLKENARGGDRVFLEPLGYIGFFSQMRTLDFPGLSSPTMVAARKNHQSWSSLLSYLGPEWAVLRAHEAENVRRENPACLEEGYDLVKTFDVRDQVAASGAPDRFMLNFDAHFQVYKRRIRRFDDDLILAIQHPFGSGAVPSVVDAAEVRSVHAPGIMVVTVPEGTTELSLVYGILPSAYAEDPKTDGATFFITLSEPGQRARLMERRLDPTNEPGDRGAQRWTYTLAQPAGPHTRLLLQTLSHRTMTKDWAYWGDVAFGR